ncbi:MAG: hypothetical protein CL947_03490 [Epsilonproteobacteria bacterium]|nr:hypothetical protein [Campylobacterota bacterium]|tara:strand:+ start:4591 stop:4926 length:336 start_codon:yes stop_codon:yes gene_type:complete
MPKLYISFLAILATTTITASYNDPWKGKGSFVPSFICYYYKLDKEQEKVMIVNPSKNSTYIQDYYWNGINHGTKFNEKKVFVFINGKKQDQTFTTVDQAVEYLRNKVVSSC